MKLVDPLLMQKGLLSRSAPALSDSEAQAALTFLQLQWMDDTRDRGLTKLCFQALVRMVLRETDSEIRLSPKRFMRSLRPCFPITTSADYRHLSTQL